MIPTLIPTLVAAFAFTLAPLEQGTQLTYRGDFDAEKGAAFDSQKTFDLTLIVTQPTATGATVYWLLDEQGRGGWHWGDRFGRLTVDAQGRAVGERGPALLYQQPEGTSVVPLTLPLVALDQPLSAGARWDEARLSFEVKGLARRGDHPAWRVEASTPYGRAKTLWVEEGGPVVLATRERVTIGRGDQFELQYELKDRSTLAADELTAAIATIDQLVALRDKLNHQPRTVQVDWNKEQLDTLKQELPNIAAAEQPAALVRLLAAANEDAKSQKDRTGAVDALTAKAKGKVFAELKLLDLSGKALDWSELEGKVVVLHFWSYQDVPLEEPYGQTGYVDFLHRRSGDQPVAVLGVVVDDRLGQGDRARVVQSAKKLRSFMNLGYPLVLDDGAIKQLGDPRVAEAKLPLFVVLGRDRKVLEYHVGLYEVDRDQGLKQLDNIARQAAQ